MFIGVHFQVHFDGWGTEYDQWLWAHSTDMYPVGWCRAVGHRLEGPLQPAPRCVRKMPPKQPRRKRRTPGQIMNQIFIRTKWHPCGGVTLAGGLEWYTKAHRSFFSKMESSVTTPFVCGLSFYFIAITLH